MGTKRARALTSIRHIAVYVEEPEPGWFQWVLIEATSDLSTWSELKWAERWESSYKDAMAKGLLALQELAADLDQGPRTEPRKPKEKTSSFGFGFGLPKLG